MTLKSDFEELEAAHRDFITAYTVFTTKKIKSRAPVARKALMRIILASKALRKSVQEFKTKI